MVKEAAQPQTLTPHYNATLGGIDDDETGRLRPDLWYRKNGTLHIVEVTVPYATPSRGGNTLEMRRREKLEKYQPLMETLTRRPGAAAELHVIVIGSLGAIPKETIKELEKLAPTSLVKRYVKRMAAAAILGSRMIYLESRRPNQTRARTDNRAEAPDDPRDEANAASSGDEANEPSAESTVDQREEETATPQPERDDTDELLGSPETPTDSGSTGSWESEESDTDDGSVVYWMSGGSTVQEYYYYYACT